MDPGTEDLRGLRFLLAGPASWRDRLAPVLSPATVESVETIDTARRRVRNGSIDGLLVAEDLADGTGIDLLEIVRSAAPTLPIVVCPIEGSERLASEAIDAGASDYFPLASLDRPEETIPDRVLRAVNGARREVTRRDRARQFDSLFQKRITATWVLDADGVLQRANEPAREIADAEIGAIVGEPFWELPWWGQTDRETTAVREVVERAIERGTVERFVTEVHGGPDEYGGSDAHSRAGGDERDRSAEDTPRMIELSVFPVENPRGELVSIVVEGDDVTERVRLYRELRRSEELHRVTLSNMTDTILVTDDDGRFTYVCPNVHFIFGYTAAEIYEFGTIDELLGEEFFDREVLAERGVLTNIETTATDREGNEHTLFVNVREVDIQGGTMLFSCRDVTKRKQREEALTALHRTTRQLLYADSGEEIARILVDDSEEIVGLSARAIYLYDPDENVLDPAAYSSGMDDLHGPLRSIAPDGGTLLGHSFIENEPAFYEDVRDTEAVANPATGLRSAAYVPIGDHGVLVVGSEAVDRFDSIAREITDLLAATAEAALDRIEREARLRVKDRTLQRQNEQLSRLNEINELIRDIDRALVRAETREEIDRTVCAALTKGSHFSFAWIGAFDDDSDRLQPRAWAGDEQGYLDELLATDTTDSDERQTRVGGDDLEPSRQAALSGEPVVVSNVGERLGAASWQRHALRRGYQSAIAVPIVYEGFVYGVLTVYADAPDAFDETAREVLAELGETIASAISGLNRKNALLTAAGTRMQFETGDQGFVLTRLAREADCSLAFEGRTRRTDEGDGILVSVDSSAVDRLLEAARETIAVEDATVLADGRATATVRLQLATPFLAGSLAAHGAVLDRIETDGSTATLTVDVPGNVEPRPIVEHVRSSFEDVELTAKYAEDRLSTHELYSAFLDRLTDRQLEVLQAAYYGGFFESPRDQNGEEIADALGISPPAFYEHIRTIQRKLFSTLFEDIGV